MHKLIYQRILFFEVALAYALPCILLGLGSVFIFFPIARLISGELDALLTLSWILGGYLGMIGIFSQFNAIVSDSDVKPSVGLRNFIFTLIGCVSVLPNAYMGTIDGSLLVLIIGCAPIFVAMQLTYMNRDELKKLIIKDESQ